MRRKGQSQVSGRITATGRAPLMIGDVQLGGSHPRIVVYLLRNKACAQLLTHLALSERFRVHVGCDSLEDGTPIRARNPRNPPPVVDAWEVCGTQLALTALVESGSCYRTNPDSACGHWHYCLNAAIPWRDETLRHAPGHDERPLRPIQEDQMRADMGRADPVQRLPRKEQEELLLVYRGHMEG